MLPSVWTAFTMANCRKICWTSGFIFYKPCMSRTCDFKHDHASRRPKLMHRVEQICSLNVYSSQRQLADCFSRVLFLRAQRFFLDIIFLVKEFHFREFWYFFFIGTFFFWPTLISCFSKKGKGWHFWIRSCLMVGMVSIGGEYWYSVRS